MHLLYFASCIHLPHFQNQNMNILTEKMKCNGMYEIRPIVDNQNILNLKHPSHFLNTSLNLLSIFVGEKRQICATRLTK